MTKGLLLGVALLTQTQTVTREDELSLQIVVLKSQLAQVMAVAAKCEAEGSQSARMAQEAQLAGQALLKALDARGLTVDAQQHIVPKPQAVDKP